MYAIHMMQFVCMHARRWVEKFEERRKQLAEQQAGSSSSSSSDAGAASTPNSISSSSGSSVTSWFPKAVLQLLQLAVVNAALILWPASLHPGGLTASNVWLAYWAYMLFFAGGSVYRLVTFGSLAARKKDAQGRTWWSIAAWLLFVISIPVIHWPPVGAFLQRQQMPAGGTDVALLQRSVITVFDVLGGVLLAAAVGLNWWAARTLGKAYDRVVAPEKLVTNGPYKYVQHPIYSSYVLLFVGYGLLMHSAPTALLALGVCLTYYLSRTRLEQAVLQQAFGQQYAEYKQRTKLFVPYVL
jgi:protein-S-isoprenylcysteine O-methyltransferase Ste14